MTSITKGSNNVYADLGMPDAEKMLLKSQLVNRITFAIEAQGLSALEASRIVGLAQPKLKSIKIYPMIYLKTGDVNSPKLKTI